MPHDLEVRDAAKRIADGLPLGSVERRFYEAMVADAVLSIQRDLERDEELAE